MKKLTKAIMLLMCAVLCCGSFGCGCNDDGDGDGEGGNTTISFASWGNETEQEIFKELVKDFNEADNGVTVKYTPIPSADYQQKLTNSLRGKNPFDVFIAGDGEIKPWIEGGSIAELDDYLAKSEKIDGDKIWAEGISRYRYDIKARKGGTESGKLYGIMRDYSPTVIYYNKNAMAKVGIECISLSPEESQTQYGDSSAFFTKSGKKYFNNQVAMDWDELLEVSKLLTRSITSTSNTQYGLYVANWFCFGRSVGADNLEWVTDSSLSTGGKYVFTMFDDSLNYKVKENKTVTVNGNTYNAGEIISYDDKSDLSSSNKSNCDVLPSQYDAVEYYVDLSVNHKVSPKPDVTGSNSSYGLFSSKQVGMLLDTRYAVGVFRKTITDFDWDVCPLPVYKNNETSVSNKNNRALTEGATGIPAGHSGSEAICISEKSTKKDAAWKFVEYLAGKEGQEAFAEAGFTVPNTEELANSDVFLQSNQKPKNSKVFVEASKYQTVGDWGYLPSKAWVNEWANPFNSYVLAGQMTLAEINSQTTASTQAIIDGYYK